MAQVSAKEIKNRIRSMESTKQITKAMEMVAASKLRRAQMQVAHSRPYFEILRDVIRDIVSHNTEKSLPYFESVRKGEMKTACIVIAGDRGLAGGYNSNILKKCMEEIQEGDAAVLPIGKKALDFFRARNVPLISESYPQAEDVCVSDCFTLAKQLCKAFKDGEYSRILIGYTRFVSVLSQVPVTMPLLPLEKEENVQSASAADVLYEPGSEEVFETIIPEYLGGIIYGALCECRAAEQAARRTAMDSATQNADEMIAELSLKFNQARQAAITQEITEIVAGS
ncbi:MAG: ATP synthase F1 subunit gamma [Clostridiales bacterium]|nr:ATP synthase F1 subunit gamma [Clostridiales bacterium]